MTTGAWIAILGVPVGLAVLIWGGCSLRESAWERTVPFDAVVWREYAEESVSPRHGMGEAARAQVLRDCATRDATRALLGEPTFGGARAEWWTLGHPPVLLWFDGCWLVVGYDADERVVTVDVSHDDH